jgi:hypothetical protein
MKATPSHGRLLVYFADGLVAVLVVLLPLYLDWTGSTLSYHPEPTLKIEQQQVTDDVESVGHRSSPR